MYDITYLVFTYKYVLLKENKRIQTLVIHPTVSRYITFLSERREPKAFFFFLFIFIFYLYLEAIKSVTVIAPVKFYLVFVHCDAKPI